jgi:phospholipase C
MLATLSLLAVAVSCSLASGSEPVATTSATAADEIPAVGAAGPKVSAPLPAAVDATAFPTRWPIKHVIFLIKENRSFDNLFGTFPGADGVTVGMRDGHAVPLARGEDQRGYDISHCLECSITAINEGKMDGFANVELHGDYAYTQLHADQLPNYWAWAEDYVLADNFFASALGPSFPNHLFTIAAQSAHAQGNPWQDFEAMKARAQQGYAKSWGCDMAGDNGYVEVRDSEGKVVRVPPCFDFETEGDLLRRAGIPWAYYAATNKQLGYMWSAYSAIDRYRNDQAMWDRYMRPVDDVVRDVRADRLPPVTWVTPRFALSEHPEYNFCHGENWTTEVINAVMESPMWRDTAIFLTWDDYGGFYDHVPPRRVDGDGFGIRVPMLILSPYAKTGYVDHTEGEFSSVLRFIENNWGLSQLTHRDRAADDLSEAFDFTQQPRPPEPQPLRTDCEGPTWEPPPPGF